MSLHYLLAETRPSIQDVVRDVQEYPPGRLYSMHIFAEDVHAFKTHLQDVIRVDTEQAFDKVVHLTFYVRTDPENEQRWLHSVMKTYESWEGKVSRNESLYPLRYGQMVKAELDKLPQWKTSVSVLDHSEIIDQDWMWITVEYNIPARL